MTKHASFKGKQLALFERLGAFGFDKFESEHMVKFTPQIARDFLRGFRRRRRERCMEDDCTTLIDDPPKQFCEEHRFKRPLGMDEDELFERLGP